MNKLFLVTHKMTGGGCERVIAQLLKRFCADGLTCTLVTECSVPSFYALPPEAAVVSLLDTQDMAARDVPKAYKKLRRLVREERPDVVLAMPEKVNVWTVLFLLGTGVPVVVSERNDPRRHPENRVKRLLRRMVYPFAKGFVFQTRQAADYFSPAIRARGTIIQNPLDETRLPKANAGTREKTVVGAGRLDRQKNFSLLISAFTRFYTLHPDWRLVIYGEGAERGLLTALAARLPDGTVTLPGQTETLAEELASCGMFVLSSDFEGMPNVLIEALAVGAPCIATDCPVGGCAALVTSGENGLLVPAGDEQALFAAMCAVAEDAGVIKQSSLERAQGVRTALDEHAICEQWRRYLERIAAK